jgi:hypothetical protein
MTAIRFSKVHGWFSPDFLAADKWLLDHKIDSDYYMFTTTNNGMGTTGIEFVNEQHAIMFRLMFAL